MRNLRTLGVERLAACDPDPTRLEPVVTELRVQPFAQFEEALAAVEPEIVFICTPPVFHTPQIRLALLAGANVFVEKPLSNGLEEVDDLITLAESRNLTVQVAYNLRFNPGLRRVKELLEANAIGQVLWARIETGQYLPEWRPWQDHRQSYTARRELGGGIILDLSHELDYALWLLGEPREIVCMAGTMTDLVVDVEDCASILMRYANGRFADVHMDCIQRGGYTRSCKLVGEQGTILWEDVDNQVRTYRSKTNAWDTFAYQHEWNDTYVYELVHFFSAVGGEVKPIVSLKEAKLVLEMALTAKASAANGCLQALGSY
jgi:predicted dehydrogenase